jgi:hypothetical protein
MQIVCQAIMWGPFGESKEPSDAMKTTCAFLLGDDGEKYLEE